MYKVIGLHMILAASVTLTGCEEESLKSTRTTLNGQWEWVSAHGDLLRTTGTPAAQSIEFSLDGIYRLYINDSINRESGYELVQGQTIYNNNDTEVIRYDNNYIEQAILYPSDDSLRLGDNCPDCFEYVYVIAQGD